MHIFVHMRLFVCLFVYLFVWVYQECVNVVWDHLHKYVRVFLGVYAFSPCEKKCVGMIHASLFCLP